MKKACYIFFAATLVLAGCAKERISPSESYTDGKQIKVLANAEAPVSTKATASDEGVVEWSVGDKIGVYDASGGRLCPLTYVQGTDKSFYGSVSRNPDLRYAVAPYNSDATATAGTYNIILPNYYANYVPGACNAPMVAAAPSKDEQGDYVFNFKHLAALVKVTYANVPIGARYFHLKTERSIAGTMSFSADLDDLTFSTPLGTDARDEVTLDLGSEVSSAGQTMSFYVPVPVARYSYFQIKLTDGNDATILGTAKKVSIPLAERSFNRAELHILPAIDLSVVDLGLSVKWASCNLGASSPEEYGGYYAWGETGTKSAYNWETYKFCGRYKNEQNMTKYVFPGPMTETQYGDNVDRKSVLEMEDDAARANLGGSWRMPTHAEWAELNEKCTWTWTTLNGVSGYKVTGPNGGSIFLPKTDSSEYTNHCYWSSSVVEDTCYFAYAAGFDSTSHSQTNHAYRYTGLTIRPVRD